MKRIHDGAIGEIIGGQSYYCDGELWYRESPEKNPSEMEMQVRNWLYYTWLSGDHIVEQHVHNIDIMNWAFGGPPVKVMGIGGRQTRTDKKYGNIFDHFGVEFEYPNGVRVLSLCRQAEGATRRIAERLVGTKGTANLKNEIFGKKKYKFQYKKGIHLNPYIQEHVDLIAAIRNNKPLNEGKRIAESTLTAIAGRMSAYTGRELKYEWVVKASRLDLTPNAYKWGKNTVAGVAVPGTTKLV